MTLEPLIDTSVPLAESALQGTQLEIILPKDFVIPCLFLGCQCRELRAVNKRLAKYLEVRCDLSCIIICEMEFSLALA